MTWKEILKMKKFRGSSLFPDAPIKEEYENDFPPRSILNKGLEMLEDKLKKLFDKVEVTDWKTTGNSIYAYVDTPRFTISVKFQRPYLTDYLAIHVEGIGRGESKKEKHDVYAITNEVLKFYKQLIKSEFNSTMEIKTYSGSSPHTWR